MPSVPGKLNELTGHKDFDGDALQALLALDQWMEKRWEPMSPHFNIFELEEPDEVGSAVTIPKPEIASISKWLMAED